MSTEGYPPTFPGSPPGPPPPRWHPAVRVTFYTVAIVVLFPMIVVVGLIDLVIRVMVWLGKP